ncbi:uncharacterized protein LOC135463735 [Liolophura sinensis]|uniref:uncharacterized protein LOC135463735 n=1 Tax=Liolophura sinensis TaxID=3198878 RepID=UPI0031597AE4
MRTAMALWIWTFGGLISFMEASRYLSDYRHGEFGIGAELQQHNTGTGGRQYHAGYPQGRGYQEGVGYQVYDRRHYPHKAWPGPASSSASASAAAGAASSSVAAAAAASGSPAAASVAAAAGAASSQDRRRGYHDRADRRVYQYPAPRYIPREFDKQPAVQSSYHRATSRPVYVHPTQAPLYAQPQQPPVYVQPTHPPVYRQWTPAPTKYQPPSEPPIYVHPTRPPVYVQRTQAPIYVQRTQAPVYVQRTQAPVYVQRTQAPVYVQRTQAPVYVQPAPTSLVSSTTKASISDCSSSTLCFCCRWTTRYSQTTQTCNQPKHVPAQQQICMAIRNGACVRLGTVSRSNQMGGFPAQCTSTRRERSCTSCCPSRYGQGIPRCTATASAAVQEQLRQQQGTSWYSAQSVGAARSAPTVVATAAASVAAPAHERGARPTGIAGQSFPDTQQRAVYQSGRLQSVSHTQQQYSQPTQERWSPATQGRSSIAICCLTTRRPECCQSSKQRRLQSSGQAIYRPQAPPTDCCSTTRRPECCASSRQRAPQSSVPERSYHPVSSVAQPLWQPQQRQQRQQQPTDCCSTTRRPECCQSTRRYGQQPQYQRSQLVASASTAWSQGDCCSTSRKPECCATSRAALGVPVSRSRTMCCGSSQPRVSCCASLRLADCCGSSRLALCCSVTNNVGKCCSGASNWGK